MTNWVNLGVTIPMKVSGIFRGRGTPRTCTATSSFTEPYMYLGLAIMFSNMPKFSKGLTTGNLFVARRKHLQETRASASRPISPATDLHKKVLPTRKSRLSEAGDVIQLVSPMVQAAAWAIPVAGLTLKAAVDGFLCVMQMVDTKNRNKADLERLASRVRSLLEFLSREPQPRDEEAARRMMDLSRRLEAISRRLSEIQRCRGFTLACSSVTKDIAGCRTDVNEFLLDYDVHSRTTMEKQLEQILSLVVSPRGCVTLVDAVGHEHEVPLSYCASFQQLKDMLRVLLRPGRSGASVQRRYIESGKFDFCIDDGKRVVQLSGDSHKQWNVEAGTKVVMRVVFEQMTEFSATYMCHLCGTPNNLVSFGNSKEWLIDGSADCYACKGRFQISVQLRPSWWNVTEEGQATQSKDQIDMETRHCICNFHVMQIRVCARTWHEADANWFLDFASSG